MRDESNGLIFTKNNGFTMMSASNLNAGAVYDASLYEVRIWDIGRQRQSIKYYCKSDFFKK